MPVFGDDDEEPPFKTLTPEQERALKERAERRAKQREQSKEQPQKGR